MSPRRRLPGRRPANQDELHVFVLWSAARGAEQRIIADLRRRFTLLDLVELTWSRERFAENLTCLYGTSLPPGSDKERRCGTGPMLVAVVADEQPSYGLRRTTGGLARVNVRMLAAKRRYRRWTRGWDLVHSSLTCREAEHDLFFLLGRQPSSFTTDSWSGVIRRVSRDLTGATGWRSLSELGTALELKAPYAMIGDAAVLHGRDQEARRVTVLAAERWEPAVVARGTPADGSDGTRRSVVRVGGRALEFRFVETGDDARLQALLDNRVLGEPGGLALPRDPDRLDCALACARQDGGAQQLPTHSSR